MQTGKSGKVNINSASVDELSRVPGINHDKAQALVNQRPFRTWDDLKNVQGFTDSNISDLKDNCTL